MIILSEYHGKKSIRQAIVFKNQNEFLVRKVENDKVIYSSPFYNQELAQDYAEDWALGENDE